MVNNFHMGAGLTWVKSRGTVIKIHNMVIVPTTYLCRLV